MSMPHGRWIAASVAVFLATAAVGAPVVSADLLSSPTSSVAPSDLTSTANQVTAPVTKQLGSATDQLGSTTDQVTSGVTNQVGSTTDQIGSTANQVTAPVTKQLGSATKQVTSPVTRQLDSTKTSAGSLPSAPSGQQNLSASGSGGATPGSSAGAGSGGGPSSSGPAGTSGSGAGAGDASPLAAAAPGSVASLLSDLVGGIGRAGRVRGAGLRQLRAVLGELRGCFYGLTRLERRVLILRVGLDGRRPHSRSQVADRLNRSSGQIRRTERNALKRLDVLARTEGCAGSAGGGLLTSIVGGSIGPAELAAVPGLVAFGNPGDQGLRLVRFTRLGAAPELLSPRRPLDLGDGPASSGAWTIQLLAIMLMIGLAGLMRAAWVGRPAPRQPARSPKPAAVPELLSATRRGVVPEPNGAGAAPLLNGDGRRSRARPRVRV
jgi:DNA-binding CsgD family transcriptional regulator